MTMQSKHDSEAYFKLKAKRNIRKSGKDIEEEEEDGTSRE